MLTSLNTETGIATIYVGDGMEFSFPIINKFYAESFKFSILDHYVYMYKGRPSCLEEFSPVSVTDGGNTFEINMKSSSGVVAIRIPYDDNLKNLMFDCARIYINFFKARNSVPKLYIDTIEEDGKLV